MNRWNANIIAVIVIDHMCQRPIAEGSGEDGMAAYHEWWADKILPGVVGALTLPHPSPRVASLLARDPHALDDVCEAAPLALSLLLPVRQ